MTSRSTWWSGGVAAITLFVDDLGAAKDFYRRAFAAPLVYEDHHSAVFDLGNIIVNLLAATQAPELIGPRRVAPAQAGARFQLTVRVQDIDAVCATLAARGIPLSNGPFDRPWGVRTVTFADPDGHVWEVAAPLDVTDATGSLSDEHR